MQSEHRWGKLVLATLYRAAAMIMVFPQPSRLNIAPKDCAAVCHEICEAQVLSLVCSEDDDGAAVERGGQKVESPDTLRFDCSSGGDGGDEGGEASSRAGGNLPLAGGGQSDAEGERVGFGGGIEHSGRDTAKAELREGHEELQTHIGQKPWREPEEGVQAQMRHMYKREWDRKEVWSRSKNRKWHCPQGSR